MKKTTLFLVVIHAFCIGVVCIVSLSLLSTSCATDDCMVISNPLWVLEMTPIYDVPSDLPSFVDNVPADADSKIAILVKFNYPVRPGTVHSRHTFQLDINGTPIAGFFYPNHGKDSFVFFSDQKVGDIDLHGDWRMCLRIKGEYGQSPPDADGNVWQFNGVYKAFDDDGVLLNTYEKKYLLDGDKDGCPGGDYVKCWRYIR